MTAAMSGTVAGLVVPGEPELDEGAGKFTVSGVT